MAQQYDYINDLTPTKETWKIKVKIIRMADITSFNNPEEINCIEIVLVDEQLGNHIIEAKVILGSNIGHKVFIPRMILSPSDPRLPFKLQRRQYPLTVCFAMTINKSQGQSLSHVGLYLQRPVFSHGQLYVALSRVKTKEGLKILICGKENQVSNTTNNVVFKEVFQNLI